MRYPPGLILPAWQRLSNWYSSIYTALRPSLFTACYPFIPVMSAGIVVRHTLKAHFCSSTTLGIAICLHSPQTKVCPLCAGAVLGTTINIVVRCLSRPPFLPDMTLGMLFVFTALRSKSVCCVPELWVPLARPSTLPSIFATLRPEFIRCVLPFWLQPLASLFVASKNLLCA